MNSRKIAGQPRIGEIYLRRFDDSARAILQERREPPDNERRLQQRQIPGSRHGVQLRVTSEFAGTENPARPQGGQLHKVLEHDEIIQAAELPDVPLQIGLLISLEPDV